ncbi:MAG: hypothetical protein D6731_14195, partial [Planctomycetota bacterium]
MRVDRTLPRPGPRGAALGRRTARGARGPPPQPAPRRPHRCAAAGANRLGGRRGRRQPRPFAGRDPRAVARRGERAPRGGDGPPARRRRRRAGRPCPFTPAPARARPEPWLRGGASPTGSGRGGAEARRRLGPSRRGAALSGGCERSGAGRLASARSGLGRGGGPAPSPYRGEGWEGGPLHETFTTQTWQVTAPAAGWLVVADVWYPGWRARVDGVPVPVLRADYLFRAVPVPAGRHQVTLTYRPWTFSLGLTITLLAL